MANRIADELLKQYLNHRHPPSRLTRYCIFELYKKRDGEIRCGKCGQIIENLDDFSVGHIKPWFPSGERQGGVELFWDLNNLQPEHKACNFPDYLNNKYGYRGVHKRIDKKYGYIRYYAMICVNGKKINLGIKKTPEEAAESYDMAIMRYRNGCGSLNFLERRDEYRQRIQNEQKLS